MTENISTTTYSFNKLSQLTFGWMDYCLFGGLLSISILIGIYFGCFGKKQDNTTEYLMGGKKMKFFPVAMSLLSSHLSGAMLLGLPTEVYQFGTQYVAVIFSTIISCTVVSFVYLPVFYKLQVTSAYEYLEMRFARSVRVLASFIYNFSLFTYLPMVLYVPTLAFSQATSIDVRLVIPVIGFVCIFYTAIGGLKAVVWTDTVQLMLTLGSFITILILGIITIGSIAEIMRIADEGGRLILWNMNPSPFARNTFWGMTVGMTTSYIAWSGVNQDFVQKYLAVPTLTNARKSLIFMSVGMVIIKLMLVFTGLMIYARYHDCDPVSAHVIAKSSQTLPYYVIDIAGHLSGLPGLFLAGLVSAGLSTVSASLNTCSGTVYKDFIDPWLPKSENREARAANIMKLLVVILGVICISVAFLMDSLGDIFQMAVSLSGITTGAMLGIFSLGMLVPWATTTGVLIGGSASLITMTYIVVGAQWNVAENKLKFETLPVSTENCWKHIEFWNETSTTMMPIKADDEPFILFTLSFMYYSLTGTLVTIIVGVITSFIFGSNNLENLNPDHFSPIIQRFLPLNKCTIMSLYIISTKMHIKNQDKEEIKKS